MIGEAEGVWQVLIDDHHAPLFKSPSMTDEQLRSGLGNLRKRIYSRRSIM